MARYTTDIYDLIENADMVVVPTVQRLASDQIIEIEKVIQWEEEKATIEIPENIRDFAIYEYIAHIIRKLEDIKTLGLQPAYVVEHPYILLADDLIPLGYAREDVKRIDFNTVCYLLERYEFERMYYRVCFKVKDNELIVYR